MYDFFAEVGEISIPLVLISSFIVWLAGDKFKDKIDILKKLRNFCLVILLITVVGGAVTSPSTPTASRQKQEATISKETTQEQKDDGAKIKPQSTEQSAEVQPPTSLVKANEILTMLNPPRLYDNIDDVSTFYANVSKSDVATTSQDIIPNNEVLIFQQVDGKIKSIVCYPQRGGLMLNINDAVPLIKSFIPIENVNGDYNMDDTTIFAGEGLPSLYVWKYDFNGDPVVAMAQETNGYISAFGVSRGTNHKFPFMPSSMYGYHVEQYGANQERPQQSQAKRASQNNFDSYDNEKSVSTMYIGNAKTGKFHIKSCESVRKMNPANVVELSSRQEAINSGYVPCGRCKP